MAEKVLTVCPYCGSGCKMNLLVEDGAIVGCGRRAWSYQRRRAVPEGVLRVGFPERHKAVDASPEKASSEAHRGEELKEVSWDEAIQFTASRAAGDQTQIRRRFHHVDRLGAWTRQRSKLCHAEIRPRGDRNQQHRSLRSCLPCAICGGIAGHAGQWGNEQFHRRNRRYKVHFYLRLQCRRFAPHRRPAHREGKGEGRKDRRLRSPPH